jgi:hypothetical protein
LRTSPPDLLIQTISARSTRTYEGVVEHLGNRGFAEQGAMLNRSLFEDMVDARWVSLNPDLAVERLRKHDRYSHALRLDVANRFPEYTQGAGRFSRTDSTLHVAPRRVHASSRSNSRRRSVGPAYGAISSVR